MDKSNLTNLEEKLIGCSISKPEKNAQWFSTGNKNQSKLLQAEIIIKNITASR